MVVVVVVDHDSVEVIIIFSKVLVLPVMETNNRTKNKKWLGFFECAGKKTKSHWAKLYQSRFNVHFYFSVVRNNCKTVSMKARSGSTKP